MVPAWKKDPLKLWSKLLKLPADSEPVSEAEIPKKAHQKAIRDSMPSEKVDAPKPASTLDLLEEKDTFPLPPRRSKTATNKEVPPTMTQRHRAPTPERGLDPKIRWEGYSPQPVNKRGRMWLTSPQDAPAREPRWNAGQVRELCLVLRELEETLPNPIQGEWMSLQQAHAYLPSNTDYSHLVTALHLFEELSTLRFKWSSVLCTYLISRK